MGKQHQIGVIGYGYWGPNLVRNFSQNSRSCVKAVADLSADRIAQLKQHHPTVAATQDYRDLLADPQIDLVAVATPVGSHHRLAAEALDAGKHVLVEKPLTAKVAEAEDLLARARRAERMLAVDHTFLFTGAVSTIKALVDSGQIGEVLYFDSVRVNLGLFQHDVNVIWDLAPHDLSIMFHLLGKSPAAVSATGSCHWATPEGHECVAYLTVHFDDQTIAHFHVNWLAPVKVRRTLIGGRNQMIVYDDMEPSEKVKVYDKGIDTTAQTAEGIYKTLIQYRTGNMHAPHLNNREALAVECDYLFDAIENTQFDGLINGGMMGLNVVRILEAAEQSIKKRGACVDCAPLALPHAA